MGPQVDNPEYLRRYFKATKSYFDMISGVYPQLDSWIYLSMGMSDSYKVAIEEGANMVRLGANIFGNR